MLYTVAPLQDQSEPFYLRRITHELQEWPESMHDLAAEKVQWSYGFHEHEGGSLHAPLDEAVGNFFQHSPFLRSEGRPMRIYGKSVIEFLTESFPNRHAALYLRFVVPEQWEGGPVALPPEVPHEDPLVAIQLFAFSELVRCYQLRCVFIVCAVSSEPTLAVGETLFGVWMSGK